MAVDNKMNGKAMKAKPKSGSKYPLIDQYTKETKRQKKVLDNPIGAGLAFMLGKDEDEE